MAGDRVCIAGLTQDGAHVRPLLPGREPWTEGHVQPKGSLELGVHMVIEGVYRPPCAPHGEDFLVSDWHIGERVPYERFRQTLDARTADLGACFGPGLQVWQNANLFMPVGSGTASLAVVEVRAADLYLRGERPQLVFEHDTLGLCDLPVTDLRFRPWTRMRTRLGALTAVLERDGALLTLGLGRPLSSAHGDRCWAQVNGVFVQEAELTGW